jgi:high mobility group protein B3
MGSKKTGVRVNAEEKKVGGKKVKDLNAPKRPLQSYMLFSGDVRADVRAANPDVKITEISKLIGEQWKILPEKQKAKYAERYQKAKQVYDVELAVYNGGSARPVSSPVKPRVEEEEEVKAESPAKKVAAKRTKKPAKP